MLGIGTAILGVMEPHYYKLFCFHFMSMYLLILKTWADIGTNRADIGANKLSLGLLGVGHNRCFFYLKKRGVTLCLYDQWEQKNYCSMWKV